MNYNPTPKSQFVAKTENLKAHHALVENEVLRAHLQIALLQYQRIQAEKNSNELGGYAACQLRLQGANEFLDLFFNLAESPPSVGTVDALNLPSNVKPLPRKN